MSTTSHWTVDTRYDGGQESEMVHLLGRSAEWTNSFSSIENIRGALGAAIKTSNFRGEQGFIPSEDRFNILNEDTINALARNSKTPAFEYAAKQSPGTKISPRPGEGPGFRRLFAVLILMA